MTSSPEPASQDAQPGADPASSPPRRGVAQPGDGFYWGLIGLAVLYILLQILRWMVRL